MEDFDEEAPTLVDVSGIDTAAPALIKPIPVTVSVLFLHVLLCPAFCSLH